MRKHWAVSSYHSVTSAMPEKKRGEAEGDGALVEALLAGAELEAAVGGDAEVDIDGEVLVGAEVVDDAAAVFGVDHVGVEAALAAGLEGADPGDGFAAEVVLVGVVLDGEGDVVALLGEHDGAPGADVEEGQGVGCAVPDAVHGAAADGGEAGLGGEGEAALDLRVEFRKVGAEGALVDGGHGVSCGGWRRQRRADGARRLAGKGDEREGGDGEVEGDGVEGGAEEAGERRATARVAGGMAAALSRRRTGGVRGRRRARPKRSSAAPMTGRSVRGTPESASMWRSSLWRKRSLGTRPCQIQMVATETRAAVWRRAKVREVSGGWPSVRPRGGGDRSSRR